MEKTNPTSDVDYQRTFDEMGDWFRTEYQCRDYIRQLSWPDGFVCERCGVTGEPWVTACGGSTSLTAGTVFQDTRKSLRRWFFAMWFITRQKNCISALVLKRALGLGSDETAWAWLHNCAGPWFDRRVIDWPARLKLMRPLLAGLNRASAAARSKKVRRCGRGREKWSSNRSRPTQARQGCLRRKSAGLHSRGPGATSNNSYKRMERLCGPALRQATSIA